jgi:hypothetical protein
LYPIYPQPYGSGLSVIVKCEFAIHDFCLMVPNVPALAGRFLAGLHLKRR